MLFWKFPFSFFPSYARQQTNFYIYYDYDQFIRTFLSIYDDHLIKSECFYFHFPLIEMFFIKNILLGSCNKQKQPSRRVLQMTASEGVQFLVKLTALGLELYENWTSSNLFLSRVWSKSQLEQNQEKLFWRTPISVEQIFVKHLLAASDFIK